MYFLALLAATIAPVQPDIPNRQPQLAVGPQFAALVFGSAHSIWFSRSLDHGRTFSAPTQIADVPALALGRHRGPRVAILGSTVVMSAIYGSANAADPHAHGSSAHGDLFAWRSINQGQTWSEPVRINDITGAAREGLHAMATSKNGQQIAAVWLDLRAQKTALYGSYSDDAGRTWSKNVLLYQSPEKTICECCHPSLVASGPDTYAVMFRNALNGNRDMYLLKWNVRSTASEAQKVGQGSWHLNACPMDGGGVALNGNGFMTAWRRDNTIFLAAMNQSEKPLGEGKDAAVTSSQKGVFVAWTNASGVQLQSPSSKNNPLNLSPVGSFPALAPLPNGSVLVAWEQNQSILTQIVPQ